MKTFKIVIIVFLLFFHIATAFVLTKADPDNLNFLMTVVDYLGVLMIGAYLALILFIAGIILHFKAIKEANHNVKELENQVTNLKAKLYDKKELESSDKAVEVRPDANDQKSDQKKKDQNKE